MKSEGVIMKRNIILRLNNKSENFYSYMGRFFGSRLVQNKTNDRVYDDPNKEWYILLEEDKPVAFVSMIKDTIKNLYAFKDEQLEELLTGIKKETVIGESVVPKVYISTYKNANLKIYDEDSYKNFVVIGSEEGSIV